MKQLSQTKVSDQRVVVRGDLDVPLNSEGEIISDFRLRALLPSLDYLLKEGAKEVIIIAHLGRPVVRPRERIELIREGNPRLSMIGIAQVLAKLLKIKQDITEIQIDNFKLPAFAIGPKIKIIENIRFDDRESKGDEALAEEIAALGDIFVYDAFAVAHRDHASTSKTIKKIKTVAGFQLVKEVEALEKLIDNTEEPYVMVLGGAKVETKMPIIERLVDQVDTFLLGGIMANNFAKAQGEDIKNSAYEGEFVELAAELYKDNPEKFLIPEDFVWQGPRIMDIGSKSRKKFIDSIAKAKTVFWNGTVGVTSLTAQDYKFGSLDIAGAMAANKTAFTVVSGGDTVGLLEEQGLDFNSYSFISTGGGATLEFLGGKELPALKALKYYK